MAEGLGAEYYISLNRKLSNKVPANIQGLQGIEYDNLKGFGEGALLRGIAKYLVKDHTHPKNILTLKFDTPGRLAMGNGGPNTNDTTAQKRRIRRSTGDIRLGDSARISTL